MNRNRFLASVTIATAGVILLAGCSSAQKTDKASETPKPKASISANPTSKPTRPPLEKGTADCKDGTATIADQNNKEVTVGDCATVKVTSSNAVIHLGAVDELVVNGAINGIDVESVKKVTITGDGNRVSTKSDPKVTDKGKQNTVKH